MRLDITVKEVGLHQTNAAIDVVADATGRNDAALRGICGTNPANAEAIAPMNVGHGEAGVLDAGQGREIGDLIRRLVLADRVNKSIAGEDPSIDEHTGAIALGDLPTAFVDALQRTRVGFL